MIYDICAFLRCIGVRVCNFLAALGVFSTNPDCIQPTSQVSSRHPELASRSYEAKKPAFSLVEILVALIIVSVIIAAMAPVITKKLASAGITIVGGGSGGGVVDGDISKSVCKSGTYWDDGFGGCKICSYKTPHCEDCNINTGVCSVCADGYELDENNLCVESGEVSCGEFAHKVTLNGLEYCMTKYNVGDKNELPLPDKITTVTTGSSCSPSGVKFCCWQGNTANQSECGSTNGSYSGCHRTVCDWRAANIACNELKYQNLSWRLPTVQEYTSLSSSLDLYQNSLADNGLMLCDRYSAAVSSRCQYTTSCNGATNNYCKAYLHWTSTQDQIFYFASGTLSGPKNYATGHGGTARCIAPLINCNSGYFSNKDSLSCATCDSKTPNCKTCHKRTGVCNTCKNGYKLNEFNQCITEDDPCGELSMKVNLNGQDYCMLKYNVGDKTELPLPSTVTKVSTGSSCSPTNLKFCCWSGNTANQSECDSKNGDYSGCKRTVCDWRAANEACSKLSYQGLDWRLPTVNEYTYLSAKLDEYSRGRGNSGLMLCERYQGYSATGLSSQCQYNTACNGGSNNYCKAYIHWTLTSGKEFYFANNALSGPGSYSVAQSGSVRCIAPLIECKDGEYSNIETMTCKSCDTHTANCELCNKKDGTCLKCKTGYKLNEHNLCITDDDPCGDLAQKVNLNGQDYCMTKYNMGDKNEFALPNTITAVTAGTNCAASPIRFCCWQGNTADQSECDSKNGDYSGCKRTVCNWRAANELCQKLSYQDLDWRLPTNAEYSSLSGLIDTYSRGKGNSGLMLCERYQGYTATGSSSQCQYIASCKGSSYDYCKAYMHWTSTSGQIFYFANNAFSGPNTGYGIYYAASTRCVAPLINCVDGYYSNIETMECESCSIKTPNCKKCHKRNGTCQECKSGYHLDKYNMCVKDDDPCGDYSMKVTLNGQDYCMTKYNIGDINQLQLPSTITLVGTGSSCSASPTNYCCWQGTTANQSECDSKNGDYSGCKRTVCNWYAANEICSKLKYQNMSWRLPTNAEWLALGNELDTYSRGRGNAGLMLCERYEGYTEKGLSSQCQYTASCNGSSSNYCKAYMHWSSTAGTPFYFASNALTGPKTNYGVYYAASVRCVAPFVNCSAGKYNESGVCTDCDKKVANCTDCNKYTGECLACREGFELKNGACMSSACGALAMQVKLGGKDMCMTKYNLGPDALQAGMADYGAGSFALPTTVKKVMAGSGTCDSDNEKCCWVGVTATSCDKANGRYSGCSRTVCNWNAAKEACSKLNYLGKTWRLPTKLELSDLTSQINTLSVGQGDNGLMLCDSSSGYSSALGVPALRCLGAEENRCYPPDLWSSDVSGVSAYEFYLKDGIWMTPMLYHKRNAFSFRCVADL